MNGARPPHLRPVNRPRPGPPSVYMEEARPDFVRDLVLFLSGVVTGIGALAAVLRIFACVLLFLGVSACGQVASGIEVRFQGETIAVLDEAWASDQLLAVDRSAGASFTVGHRLIHPMGAIVAPEIDEGEPRIFGLPESGFAWTERAMRLAIDDNHGLELEGLVRFEEP